MSEGLLRQRRNLIILTCVMWFLQYAQIDIKEFTILGIAFSHFNNPIAVFTSLWIIWFYFAWRYYQYFMQEGLSKVKETFLELLHKYTSETFRDYVQKIEPRTRVFDTNILILRRNNWKMTYTIRENGANNLRDYTDTKYEISIPRRIFIIDFLKILVTIFFNKSVLTDYILPIILFVGVLLYSFTGWKGSVVSVIKNIVAP